MFWNSAQYVYAKALVASVRLALSLACILVPTLRAAGPEPRLVAEIRDYAGVPRETLDLAEAQVSKLFGRAGVPLELWEWPGSAAVDFAEVKPALVVLLLPDSMTERLRCPGSAFGLTAGNQVYVFADRTRLAATESASAFSGALGVVMAHEIGHVLLGPGHTADGIMRPRLGRKDFLQGERGALLFEHDQAERMRERIRARQVPEFTVPLAQKRAGGN